MAPAAPQSEAQNPSAARPEGGARPATQVIALSRDPSLLQVLQDVIANEDLVFLSDEAALARHLLEGRAGVVLLDTQTVGTALADLASKLHAQLPDLALIAAGTTQDEPALAALLTTGVIHRFLHKPVSAQRVKLFIDAAWRRHESAVSGTWPALPQLPEPAPADNTPLGLAPAAAVALAVVVAGVTWLVARPSGPRQPAAASSNHGATSNHGTVARDLPVQVPIPAIPAEAPPILQRPLQHKTPAPPPRVTPLPGVRLVMPAAPQLVAEGLNLELPAPAAATPVAANAAAVAAPADAGQHKPISALMLNKTHFIDPVYPLSARGHDDNGGLVDLEFTVRADGSVADVVVTHATPQGVYEAAAVDAVRQWRYEPIQREGHAVDQRVYLELRFAYRDPNTPP